MELSDSSPEALLRLAHNLRELEVVIGDRARPVVAELRARLAEAEGKRRAGHLPDALKVIRAAMERLAELGSQLDPVEGAMMRLIAEQFAQALRAGDKTAAKEAVNAMRRKAGDSKDEDQTDW